MNGGGWWEWEWELEKETGVSDRWMGMAHGSDGGVPGVNMLGEEDDEEAKDGKDIAAERGVFVFGNAAGGLVVVVASSVLALVLINPECDKICIQDESDSGRGGFSAAVVVVVVVSATNTTSLGRDARWALLLLAASAAPTMAEEEVLVFRRLRAASAAANDER